MGTSMLQACIVMPWKKVESDTLKYSTYNPYLKNEKFEVPLPAHEPGAYWSQMRSFEEYVSVLNMIDGVTSYNSVLHNTLYADTVLHSVIYDFMAFTAQYLGFYRDDDPIKIIVLRHVLTLQIDDIVDPLFACHGIKEHFQLIARICRPLIDAIKVSPSTQMTLEADRILKHENLEEFSPEDVAAPRNRPMFNTKYKNINFETRFIPKKDREINEDPVEKHDNKPPNFVEPPLYNSRYLHIQRTETFRRIHQMQMQEKRITESPSNMELLFSSPERIPNASDNDEKDDNSISSSITSADKSCNSESRIQDLTPPRPRLPDDSNPEPVTDTIRKRTLTEVDGGRQEHTWESNSENSKFDYTNRQPKGKAKLQNNEDNSNNTAIPVPTLDIAASVPDSAPALDEFLVTKNSTILESIPKTSEDIEIIPVHASVNTTEPSDLQIVYGEDIVTISDGIVNIKEPSLYLTLLQNGQMPPLVLNPNWEHDDFGGPDFKTQTLHSTTSIVVAY